MLVDARSFEFDGRDRTEREINPEAIQNQVSNLSLEA